MKILVLQLARIGDIYMSWPALRALRRAHPLAEIHLLTRPRFAAATLGLSAIQKVIHLPTTDILAPLAQEEIDVNQSFNVLSGFIETLQNEKYDWIINFSFSPFSSYLTHSITHPTTKVSGYTRTSDSYLSIPDDVSAYFYAQVGVDRPNRFHLIELFASQIAQDLLPEDWRGPTPFPTTNKILPQDYIVVHVGASDLNKAVAPGKWVEIITALRQIQPIPVVLVGGPDEEDISLNIADALGDRDLYNYVGKTDLQELFPILKKARLLVGADSAPIHMANFTNTPVVNISVASVNFWETGPRTLESVVIKARYDDDLAPERVAGIIHKSLEGKKQDLSVIHVVAGTPSYWTLNNKEADFDWFFTRALYLGEDFPTCDEPNFIEALTQLGEINKLMMEQMEVVERTGDVSRAAPFIQRGEEIIETIAKLVPAMQILVRWYQTEKIRIPPGEMRTVLARTLEIHRLLHKVLDLYAPNQAMAATDAAKEAP